MSLKDSFNSSGPSRAEIAAFIAAAAAGDERAVGKYCKKYPDWVDATNKDDATALNAAARNNQFAVGEILLDAMANPNKPSLFGESPFLTCIAFSFHNPDDYRLLDKMLLRGANVNFQQKAWDNGSLKQEETLTTPLMTAASLQDEKLCDWLLKRMADPTLKDKDGKTARDHVQDFLNGPIGNAPDEFTDRLIAKLEKAEKEWTAARPTDEWRGKVSPSTWQGH